MDLDPGEGVTWPAMIAAAARCATGSRRRASPPTSRPRAAQGLHVLAPLRPGAPPAGPRSRPSPRAWPGHGRRRPRPLRRDDRQGRAARAASSSTTCATAATTPPSSPTAPAPDPAPRFDAARPGRARPRDRPAHFTVATAPARIAATARPPGPTFAAPERRCPGRDKPLATGISPLRELVHSHARPRGVEPASQGEAQALRRPPRTNGSDR